MTSRLPALALAWLLITVPATGESSRPLVGHAMALLAVFEQAETLPPETSPEANALIHVLIQTQAALTKSTNPATRKWFADALHQSHPPGAEPTLQDGLTSRALEAILTHAVSHSPSERPEVRAGLMEFNVRQADLDLLARVYWNTRDRLRSAGQDIHRAYEAQRRAMPFR
ncbi:MAG: hypothetical protein AABY67_05445 [Nitrospirota bacterium]